MAATHARLLNASSALRTAAGLPSGSHGLDRLGAAGRQLAHVLAHALHRALAGDLGIGAELLDVWGASLTHGAARRHHRRRGRRTVVPGRATRRSRCAGVGRIRTLGRSRSGAERKQQGGDESGLHVSMTFGTGPETPGAQINVREPLILREEIAR